MNFFSGRKLAIATNHHKEEVIAQKVIAKLGVLPFVPPNLDTDQFGTYSGEVKRMPDPVSTLRKKCELAIEQTGIDLAIASEGSFGPHPSYFFIPADEEIVMLLDKKNGLEIVGKKLSTETNFDGKLCTTEEELIAFASRSGFPSHGLILRDNKDSCKSIFKGIGDKEDLVIKFQSLLNLYGHAFVETDMRALFNPTRMKVIGEAADILLERALVPCEQCGTPGFGITDIRAGLKCEQCGSPTQSTAVYIHSCMRCGYKKEQPIPFKTVEDPMYCDFCNP